ncbi:MAG: HD domain-containing protein [Dehalococcoidia bacterium]|jgi:poly(A) polymerase|nr:HD domain-containing protein [Dehalococcoidia bacterium]
MADTEAHPCHVVGGFVRDAVLGRTSRDIDLAVAGSPFQIAQEVARALGASYVPLDEAHSVARVVLQLPRGTVRGLGEAETTQVVIDFAGYEGTLDTDLRRRDFTIDAIAVPAAVVASAFTGEHVAWERIAQHAVDPTGGLQDLSARKLRATGPSVFEADPGRLLRAVRLAREFSLSIEPRTEAAIRASAGRLPEVAAERTREELLRLLALPDAGESLHALDRLGLLTSLFPELERCRGVEQPTVHFWDVLEHSIQTVSTFEMVTAESDWRYGNEEMLDYVPDDPACRVHLEEMASTEASRGVLIKLACLLHDIAKPQTRVLDDTGRARFLGHAADGAAMVRDMLQRLRFSTSEASYVEMLVRQHLRPAQMSCEGMPTSRAVYRFFRDSDGAGIGVLYVAMADYLACRGPLFTMSEWQAVCSLVRFILSEHRRQEAVIAPSKIIDGHELMRALGLGPGPAVGTLLETIRESQAAGLVSSSEEAIQLARKTLESERSTVVRTAK